MPNSGQSLLPADPNSSLAQWLRQTIGRGGLYIQLRLRGNNLHILCESDPCPQRAVLLKRLIPALQRTDINALMPVNQPPIYHLLVYGRQAGHDRPSWTSRIYLNQLDRHLEQLRQLQLDPHAQRQRLGSAPSRVATMPTQTSGALVLTNRSQAKRGQLDAIARYLSETLSTMGIGVKVHAIPVPVRPQPTASPDVKTITFSETATQRLWVICEASYSPDPMLIGEPIARKLRDLELEGFRDAVILIQVTGEPEPDWALRIDLTPPTEMLREWARWGDGEAIARLVQQTLSEQSLHLVNHTIKGTTLHLFCGYNSEARATTAPDRETIRNLLSPLLESLAPQGIHAATLYGQIDNQEAPAWIDWLDLPAVQHPALAEPAAILAKRGEWDAIAFLLNRLLNPDLDQQLETGGIRPQLLQKQDLLHVMTDAPICPDQRHVCTIAIKFLKALRLPGVAGLRIYGRRSGQKRPLWSYGIDFVPRQRLVPDVTPEFAATDAFVSDLVAQPDENVFLPDLTPADLQNAWVKLKQNAWEMVQHGLIRSQLIVPIEDAPDSPPVPKDGDRETVKLTLIWGVVGLLSVVHLDWALNHLVQQVSNSQATDPAPLVAPLSPPASALLPPGSTEPLSRTDIENGTFNSDGFTQDPAIAPPLSPAPSVARPDLESPFPTFNSRQLDEKIALYYRLLEDWGPPDVLIVGSSRALRGVDPAALEQYLADLGYTGVRVFNFGVNGATAQVVELIVRRILTPDQMPRLILWADGARAFNSGTVDVTYNGIAVSEGYRQLAEGTLAIPQLANNTDAPSTTGFAGTEGLGASLSASYRDFDHWLSDRLSQVSSVHAERDRLKAALQDSIAPPLPTTGVPLGITNPENPLVSDDPQSLSVQQQEAFDLDGFLPLSTQFNPATYYQHYARVAGAYDSDYEDFRIEGKQAQSLQTLMEFTRSQDIPVVFVNLPLTNDYLDPVRQQHEEEFRQYMLSVAVSQPGLVFRDMGDLWSDRYEYFSDPSHLNRYGALAVSEQLAQDAMIPWFKHQE